MTFTAVKPEPRSRKGTTDGHLVLFRFTGIAFPYQGPLAPIIVATLFWDVP